MSIKKGVLKIHGSGRLSFYCKGCKMIHMVETDTAAPIKWGFNGNYDKPTFTPSILVRYPLREDKHQVVCHSFVTDGRIQYLSDCTHEYAGQTLDLEDT